MDEFLLFLTIGLVILIAFIGFFDIPYVIQPPEHVIISKNLSDAFLVGQEDDILSYTQRINIGISRQPSDDVAFIGNKELYNGLFFGKNRIIRHLSVHDANKLKIKFDVESTNAYGNLVIKINGRIAKNQVFYEGSYEIIFDENLSDDMDIEIFCTSSGWRIWAPAVYNLSNITLTASGYIDKEKVFTFNLGDEYTNYIESRLNFVLDKNVGEMAIVLNGYKLYDDALNSLASLELKRRYFRSGENTIVFTAKNNSVFDGKAMLNIIYRKEKEKVFYTTFNITDSLYKSMKRGRITFDIISVKKPGGFVIKIGTGYKEFEKAEEKAYTFYFTKDDISKGRNEIIIQALEGSTFYIKDFEVRI